MNGFTMQPSEVAQSYDQIAHRWQDPRVELSGLDQHKRALAFVKTHGNALDVGCGCSGRLIDLLISRGFRVQGVDVSERMIALARQRHPGVEFYHHDICTWTLPRAYDFITGWDSIWHVPLDTLGAVLEKLCGGLNRHGVFIFTIGGVDQPGEVRDSYMGPAMYTATLGIPETLAVLDRCGCVCRHLEYDQHPQPHVYVIAQKA